MLDGILHVNGTTMQGARMFMVDASDEAAERSKGLDHFSLTLDLNKGHLEEPRSGGDEGM